MEVWRGGSLTKGSHEVFVGELWISASKLHMCGFGFKQHTDYFEKSTLVMNDHPGPQLPLSSTYRMHLNNTAKFGKQNLRLQPPFKCPQAVLITNWLRV